MTDATMLEKAARALLRAKYGDADDSYWEMLPEGMKELARAMARAVLMAVREPDELMENATDMEWHPSTNFSAMIDAILADGEGR